MSTTAGYYVQHCTFCGDVAGRTDNAHDVDVIGECCQGLPEPWSRGRGGLFGTNARYADLGDVTDGDGPYDDDEDPDACDCTNCMYGDRYEQGDLRFYEFESLTQDDREWYEDTHGVPAATR